MANRIMLKGRYEHEEAVAAGTIKPGMLIEQIDGDKVQAHSTEGGYAERLVAVEDALQGKSVADSYSAGDVVSFAAVLPGSECQMLLKAGESVSIGERLISGGNGTVICQHSEASTTTVRQIIAVSREVKDLTPSGSVDTLITVRML